MSNITEKVKTLGTKVKNSIKDGASNFVSNVKAAIVYKENAALIHSVNYTVYTVRFDGRDASGRN